MDMTERDLETFRWLNGYGAATSLQVANKWGVSFTTAARRIRLQLAAGLIEKKSIAGVSYNPLVCTAAGCKSANDELPPLQGVRSGTIYHDLKVVDWAGALTKKFGGSFEPARRIQHRRLAHEQFEHCPDGFLHLPGRNPIAFELELSAKSPARLKKIFEYYARQMDIEKVLYLTANDGVFRLLKRIAHDVSCEGQFQIEKF